MDRTPSGMLGPKRGAKPRKRSGAQVVETAMALKAGSVGVADVIAGEVAVLRVKYGNDDAVALGEYGPPTLCSGKGAL